MEYKTVTPEQKLPRSNKFLITRPAQKMDVFEESFERFNEKLQAARKHLGANKLKNASKSIKDCTKQIKNMEREARHSDGIERKRLLTKIQACKQKLQAVSQEHQQVAAGGSSPNRNARNNELYGGGNNSSSSSSHQKQGQGQSFNAMSDSNKTRARILENTSTQKETDDLLLDSQRIANETREIGTAALNSIEDQTDMLIEAKDSVNKTHLETKRAGELLNTMSRRVCTNKLFLACVVLMLLGINILVIYLFHDKTPPTPAPPSPVAPAAAADPINAALHVPQLLSPLSPHHTNEATIASVLHHPIRSLPPQHLHHNNVNASPIKVTFVPPPALTSPLLSSTAEAKDEAAEIDQQPVGPLNLGRFRESQTFLRKALPTSNK